MTAYRTTPHSTTGVSPARLLFGREIRSKIPELIHVHPEDSEVRDRDAEMKQKQKAYADARRRACTDSGLEVGDAVGTEVLLKHPTGRAEYRRNVTHVKKYCSEKKGERRWNWRRNQSG